MYKVLIVDDEAPARELLKMKIDWAALDCEICGTAKNGKEALKLYHEQQPDLVITDIQMPVMNGLELIEQIKSVNSHQPIIILSCHESFSFARKAIQLGVNDYLIKDSFESDELYMIITDTFKTVPSDTNRLPGREPSGLEKENALITRELIHGQIHKDDYKALIKKHQLNLHGNQFELLYIDIEVIGQDVTNPTSQFLTSIQRQNIHSLLKNSLAEFALGEICHDENNVFLALYGVTRTHSQIDSKKEAISIANHMRHSISDYMAIETTIGISQPINHLNQLANAYADSQYAANRKIISGYNKTYVSAGVSNMDEDQYIKILNVKLSRIGGYLEELKFMPIIKEVNDIFLQNLKGFMQYYYLKHTNWTLLSMLMEFCSKNSLSFIELSGQKSPWEAIMDIKTVDGMCSWFISNIQRIEDNLKPETEDVYSYHVSKCIKYINTHYDSVISLRDLAEKYDINNAYLSRIFKKETGKSLTDYTNDVRIEEAKALIQNSNKKMYEIAELCGFSSTQRFFMVFKKLVAVSPGDFRKKY